MCRCYVKWFDTGRLMIHPGKLISLQGIAQYCPQHLGNLVTWDKHHSTRTEVLPLSLRQSLVPLLHGCKEFIGNFYPHEIKFNECKIRVVWQLGIQEQDRNMQSLFTEYFYSAPLFKFFCTLYSNQYFSFDWGLKKKNILKAELSLGGPRRENGFLLEILKKNNKRMFFDT